MTPTSLIHGRRARQCALRCRAGVASLLIATLAACGSSAPIRYHSLSPVAAAAPAGAYDGPNVEIGAVQVPPELSRQELVRETAEGRFEVRESDHWAAPLGRLARQTLAEDLAARLPAAHVTYPGASWPVASAVVQVDVLSFRVAGGQAMMVASWSTRPLAATAPASAAALTRRAASAGDQLHLQTPAGDGADATARAWNELLGQLADRLVVALGASAAD